jgi:dephospho-CoA kinase
MNIYHISGVSGSGKTTLLLKLKNKLGNKVVFIDTDKIFDKNGIDLLNSSKYKNISTDSQRKSFIKLLTKYNDQDAFYKITQARAENKDVIIIGHTLFGKSNPIHYADYGYYIDISPQTVYERLNSRHLAELCQYKSAIISAQKEGKSDLYISFLILFKFKIRNEGDFPTPYNKIENMINDDIKFYKKQKYNIFSADKIYKDIAASAAERPGLRPGPY